VAAELDYDRSELSKRITYNPDLRDILGPLASDQVIKRTNWEARAANNTSQSPFQKAALLLEKGIPADFR
jgi:hypothetical protein